MVRRLRNGPVISPTPDGGTAVVSGRTALVPAKSYASPPVRAPPEAAARPWTVQEFASAYRVTGAHVYALIQRGELPAVVLGTVKRIPPSVVADKLGLPLAEVERLRVQISVERQAQEQVVA
jgi:hypothetical protein